MAFDPEMQRALDEDFKAWLQALTPETVPPKAREAFERGDDAEFDKELRVAFLAEVLEDAISQPESGFLSTVKRNPDGTLKLLWFRPGDTASPKHCSPDIVN